MFFEHFLKKNEKRLRKLSKRYIMYIFLEYSAPLCEYRILHIYLKQQTSIVVYKHVYKIMVASLLGLLAHICCTTIQG